MQLPRFKERAAPGHERVLRAGGRFHLVPLWGFVDLRCVKLHVCLKEFGFPAARKAVLLFKRERTKPPFVVVVGSIPSASWPGWF